MVQNVKFWVLSQGLIGQRHCCADYVFSCILPRDAVVARYMLWAYVCLPVSVSVCHKSAEHRITQTPPHDSPGNIVFFGAKELREIRSGSTPAGRQMQVGWVKIGDVRQITGYISKTMRDRRTVSIVGLGSNFSICSGFGWVGSVN